MQWITKYLSMLGLWTLALAIIFVGLTVPGGGLGNALTTLPTWTSRALALASFPAGIAVSQTVLPDNFFEWRKLVWFSLVTIVVAMASFALANYLGPALQDPTTAGVGGSDHLSFREFRVEVFNAVRAAKESATPTIDQWFAANSLVWQYDARVTASLLPIIFGWIGALAGFWLRMIARNDLRQLQYWALGLFLVMSTYLAGENSYELIVMRAAGPVFFAGLFIFFVPMMLLGILAWCTGVLMHHRQNESEAG